MGQWILDGNLPYVDRTAVKPPLLYYLYALFVKLSFEEIFLIRFYTCALLLINLIFLNKIFKNCFNVNFSFILITSFIFSSTYIIKDSNALFSENFATTFLLIGLYYFIRLNRNSDFFLLGFFFSLRLFGTIKFSYCTDDCFFIFYFKIQKQFKRKS